MGIDEQEIPESDGEVDLADLLRRTWPRLEGILARFHVPPEDADDVVGDTLLQFARKRAHIRSPEQWLKGALRNQCRMYWRARSRRRTAAVDPAILELLAGGAEPDAERAALRRGLSRWIAELPRNCRRLLRLRYGLGLEAGEVADETGYKRSSVDKVTSRCVEALSKKLAAAERRRPRGPSP